MNKKNDVVYQRCKRMEQTNHDDRSHSQIKSSIMKHNNNNNNHTIQEEKIMTKQRNNNNDQYQPNKQTNIGNNTILSWFGIIGAAVISLLYYSIFVQNNNNNNITIVDRMYRNYKMKIPKSRVVHLISTEGYLHVSSIKTNPRRIIYPSKSSLLFSPTKKEDEYLLSTNQIVKEEEEELLDIKNDSKSIGGGGGGNKRIDIDEQQQKEEECTYQYEWQNTVHPTCNTIHETPLYHNHHDTIFFIANGYYRDVWRITTTTTNNNNSSDKLVIKTLRMQRDFSQRMLEKHRIDAVAMDQLSTSPHILSIYGHCKFSINILYIYIYIYIYICID